MAEEVSQKIAPWQWSDAKHEAAQLLAADELTDQEIADKIGVSRRTIWCWKTNPEFAERVKEITRQLGDIAMRYAVGRRTRRIKSLDDRVKRMQKVIEERAADQSMASIPGGKTGLVIVKEAETVLETQADGSQKARVVPTEVAVDTALLRELRETEKQAAIEIGQWTEKYEHAISEQDIQEQIARELAQLASGGTGADAGTIAADEQPATESSPQGDPPGPEPDHVAGGPEPGPVATGDPPLQLF